MHSGEEKVEGDRWMAIDYAVDHVNSGEIRGWAWLPTEPETALAIELVAPDGTIAHQVAAANFRPDLASAGKRNGWCAFRLSIDSELASGPYELRARHGETSDL